jgi:hypothetical protein
MYLSGFRREILAGINGGPQLALRLWASTCEPPARRLDGVTWDQVRDVALSTRPRWTIDAVSD